MNNLNDYDEHKGYFYENVSKNETAQFISEEHGICLFRVDVEINGDIKCASFLIPAPNCEKIGEEYLDIDVKEISEYFIELT